MVVSLAELKRFLQVDQTEDYADTDAVHSAITLTVAAQDITTGITNPVLPRVLSITGNRATMNKDITITGTDITDSIISEIFAENDANTVEGVKVFKSVTLITVPAYNVDGDTVIIGWGNTAEDKLYQELINSAEAKVKNIIGGLAAADYTENYDPTNIICSTHYPIISVTSLKKDGTALTEDTDFYVYGSYIKCSNCSGGSPKTIELKYNAGFVTVPEDIKKAIKLTAAFYLRINSELNPQTETDYRMPKEVLDLLDPHIRIRF